MREYVLVYDTGGGIKEIEVNEGVRRISGSSNLTTLESHLLEHAAILGSPYQPSSNEYIRVKNEGGGLRDVPVTQGVNFVRSYSNKVTFDGHLLEHTAMDNDTPLSISSNEYVLVYDTGGGSRQVPVIDGCLFIEGERYLSTYSDHNSIHSTTGLPPGLDIPAIGRTMLAKLTSSLILDEGTGGPTWSRATKAWGFNELGYLEELASGCAFFGGARLVRNLVPTPSNTLAIAGTKTVTLTQAATLQFSMGAGAGTATFSGTGGATGTLAAGAGRVSVNKTVTAGTFIVTASVDALVDLSIVDVTNYDASYVPEYVSVGVSRNEIINTEDPSNASWTMVGGIGTKTAIITDGPNGNQINVCRVTVGVSTTGLRIQGSGIVTSGAKISGSVWVRKISGSGTQVTMDLNDAGTAAFTINSVWQQIQLADISHASASVKFIDTSISTATWTTGDIIEFCYPQYNYGSTLNDYTVVGGSYVYDGAGIDGAKYFETDWQGAPISSANLLGFRREVSAVNNLLWSRDFPSGLNTAKWVPSASGAEQLSSGTIGVVGTATAATYNTGTGAGTVTRVDGSNQSYVAFSYNAIDVVKIAVTNTGALDLYIRPTGFGTAVITVPVGQSVTGYVTGYANYYITTNTGTGTFTVTSVKNTDLRISKTATGLDGIANTATTLTATATDATILQPITLASAARCASAYVKRRTGTGTISFTQDGGSTWADITSQINSSTWSRVQITSTLANPSVGFKISTSGDAIDVDCAQNEAGAIATSPIVTTTAAVTRNAENLTYQTASNLSDTAGTVYIEVEPYQWSVGGLIGSATNGLLGSASNSGATAYDGTNSANGPTGTPTGRKKLAMRWGGGAMTVASDGVLGTPGTYDGGMGLSSIGIAINSSLYCGNVAIYNYKMTDAELQAITA